MALNLIILGPPGAGKGTQAERFARQHGLPKISTGDMLRDGIKRGLPLALTAKEKMNRGELVDDETMIGIVRERLTRSDTRAGFILDGFPRNLAQAKALEGVLGRRGETLEGVLRLVVDEGEILQRMAGRGRSDDNPQTVRRRLEVYRQETAPLIEYYRGRGKMREVNGVGSIPEVFGRLRSALAELLGHDHLEVARGD